MTARSYAVLAALAGLAAAPMVHHAAPQQHGPLTVTRLYTGPDGQTHAEDMELKLAPRPGNELQEQSEVIQVSSARFIRAAAGYIDDWHHPERPQYLVTISGHGEIEMSDGTKVQLLPGRILLVEDTTGKGHRTRTIGSEPRISVDVPITTN